MILQEESDKKLIDSQLHWHQEPANWLGENNQLIIYTDKETDFWQRTHYGFSADNGHFLYAKVDGNFVLESHIQCDYKHQYDQAGLMVRVTDKCWLKPSVEYETNGPSQKLGEVVTNHGYSDWSIQNVKDDFTEFKLRITRIRSCYKVEYFHEKDDSWVQLRISQLFDHAEVQVGLYACSSKANGFHARFNYLSIGRHQEVG